MALIVEDDWEESMLSVYYNHQKNEKVQGKWFSGRGTIHQVVFDSDKTTVSGPISFSNSKLMDDMTRRDLRVDEALQSQDQSTLKKMPLGEVNKGQLGKNKSMIYNGNDARRIFKKPLDKNQLLQVKQGYFQDAKLASSKGTEYRCRVKNAPQKDYNWMLQKRVTGGD